MTKQLLEQVLPDPRTNRVLAALPPADFEAFMADARMISVKFKKRLLRQGERIDSVLFPVTCMISLLVGTSEKDLVETATIGNEGVAGASELLHDQPAMGQHLVQLPGFGVTISAEAFRKHLRSSPVFKALIERHAYALLQQVLWGAACNRLHSMEERCARWLLMTHDRAIVDTFPITQEFLSTMLAVRRATVNVATGMLKKAGFIQYVRGQMTVVDRPGLESASCNCYTAVVRAYDYNRTNSDGVAQIAV